MPISYPLSLPMTPGIREITLRKRSVVAVSTSPFTGQQQVQAHPAQWWEADLTLPTMRSTAAAAWEAFFGKLNGRQGTFLLGDPYRESPIGSATSLPGTPVVSGAHATHAQGITLSGAPALASGYLRAGDYLQIGSGSTARLYQSLYDADSDSSGEVDLTIWPKLRTALIGGETVVFLAPKGVFRMDDNSLEIYRQPGGLTTISFRASEAI